MNAKIYMGVLLTLSLFFTSCAEDAIDQNPDGMGRLTVRLTDAPFPYSEVEETNVTIYKIELRKAAGEDSGEEDGGSPFIPVMLESEEVKVNLLTLTNGVTRELADVEIPAGTYDLIRVYVKDASVLLTNGETYGLEVPSGQQTGVKVFIKPGLTVEGGLSSDLLLDFDVSKSFVARGNIKKANFNGFIFKPVILASNTSVAGTLTGTVNTMLEEAETGLEGAQISVIAADTVYKTGQSDTDGNYLIDGILAGTYKAVAEKDAFISSDTVDIEIIAANKTTQDFLLEADETAGETTDGN